MGRGDGIWEGCAGASTDVCTFHLSCPSPTDGQLRLAYTRLPLFHVRITRLRLACPVTSRRPATRGRLPKQAFDLDMIQWPENLQDDFTCGMMPCPRLLELGIHAVGYVLAGIYGTLGLWARGKGEQRHRQRRIQLVQSWRQDQSFKPMGVCEGHILWFFKMGRRTTLRVWVEWGSF